MNRERKSKAFIYLKFGAIITLSALAGAALSLFFFGNEQGVTAAAAAVGGALVAAGPWLLAAGFGLCAAAQALLAAGRRHAAAYAAGDEDAYDKADWTLCLAMACASLTSPWMITATCLSLPGVSQSSSALLGAYVVAAVLGQLVWGMGLQAAITGQVRRIAPEKQGNVFDTRFQKDWYASCDEAERQRIGECAQFSFRLMSNVYPFVMVAVLLASLFGGINVLWALGAGALWMTHMLSYLVRGLQLDARARRGGEAGR